jgi:hypothetical protein
MIEDLVLGVDSKAFLSCKTGLVLNLKVDLCVTYSTGFYKISLLLLVEAPEVL